MDFLSLQRVPGSFQQPLTAEHIRAVTARAFGSGTQIESARELSGGEYNTIFRVTLAGHDPVILRVAPDPAQWVPWHEEHLLRHEQSIQPYFAALGPLLPRTLFVDFTHDLIGRDYLFQTCMPGEQWTAVAPPLTPDEEAPLWRELASIAKRINAVEGSAFGHPHPGRQFPTWSMCLLDWLERTRSDIERAGQDGAAVRAIRACAAANAALLDEIARPHLLHGDLWPFNVLILRGTDGWHISAVLDYDRAAWGDPFAEWTFHLLPRRATPEVRAIFWEEYGMPERTASAHLRELIYEGMHAGTVLADAGRRGDEKLAATAHGILSRVVADLDSFH